MPDIVSAIPPTMPELLPQGTAVGRHMIDNVLRDGGMATVYLGHHQETQARVAIKVLHTDYVHKPEFVARFDREATLMGRLSSCPQIVGVHDVGSLPDRRRYLVMDFVRGHDLRDELDQLSSEERVMDLPRAVSIIRDIAAGLAVAHRLEVVHRDIKPSNIMLESSAGRETAKLLDFGISADLSANKRGEELTAGGTVIGTTRYMAPEQAAGISNVATVDIWGMGVVLLEMLTGRPPPQKGWGLRGPDLGGLPDMPDRLRTLISSMVQPDSTRRVQSAHDVERQLLAVLPELGAGAPRVPPAAVPQPSAAPLRGATQVVAPKPPSARIAKRALAPLWWGVAAAIVLVGGASTGWWMVLSIQTPPRTAESTPPTSEPPAPEAAVAAMDEPPPEPSPDEELTATPPAPDVGVASPVPEPADPPVEADPVHEATAQPSKPVQKPAHKKPKAHKRSCESIRNSAHGAALAGEWKSVLADTKSKRCWSGKGTARERLRVKALYRLGRHAHCEREGQESGDPTVWSIVELCRKAADD